MTDEQILLYLFRDVGLYWERYLSKDEHRQRLSTRANAPLHQFVRHNRVVYHITNAKHLQTAHVDQRNLFFMTETGSTRVGSLIKHLRNSIMHGRFEIIRATGLVEIKVSDAYGNRTTMVGRIDIPTLQELMTLVAV